MCNKHSTGHSNTVSLQRPQHLLNTYPIAHARKASSVSRTCCQFGCSCRPVLPARASTKIWLLVCRLHDCKRGTTIHSRSATHMVKATVVCCLLWLFLTSLSVCMSDASLIMCVMPQRNTQLPSLVAIVSCALMLCVPPPRSAADDLQT